MPRLRRVAIVINRAKPQSLRTAAMLKDLLHQSGIKQIWREALPPARNLFGQLTDLRSTVADLIVACGGDGTLLQTAHRSRGSGVPIIGINIGYLGFITSLRSVRLKQAVRRILDSEFVVSQRAALELAIEYRGEHTCGWALNDAVIARGPNPHLISISACIGKRPFTSYRCDGLIVSTPTGSTAYSLAAGGPIVSPECNVLTVTPICPHSLTNRSVVIDSSEPIKLKLITGSATVQVDGMELSSVAEKSRVLIQVSKDTVPLAFLPEINYYNILSEKLGWANGLSLSRPGNT